MTFLQQLPLLEALAIVLFAIALRNYCHAMAGTIVSIYSHQCREDRFVRNQFMLGSVWLVGFSAVTTYIVFFTVIL